MTEQHTPAHETPADEAEGRAIQDELRGRVVLDEPGPPPGTGLVTGSTSPTTTSGTWSSRRPSCWTRRRWTSSPRPPPSGEVSFPYVPGLLAFREIPTVLAALDALPCAPGLVVCDGYGLAHPRRFGLASHLGVLTGLPTIGVAKNPFTFTYDDPGAPRGSASPLLAGDRGGRPGAAHPGRRQARSSSPSATGSSLDNACAHTLRPGPPTTAIPETHPPGGLPVPAGPAGGDRLRGRRSRLSTCD